MLRFISAGESHGQCLVAVLEGLPAGLKVDIDFINQELSRRQEGYGRGQRMQIEKDRARIVSGIKAQKTIGSPVTVMIENRDFKIEELPSISQPRPGHADLAGAIKYGFNDIRCVLERASARETAARVAAGALCKLLLREFSVCVESQVLSVGGESNKNKIKDKIDKAKAQGDTLGGIFEVSAKNVPAGLGSYVHYDRRLDARLAFALMSIPAIKGVEFGIGFAAAGIPGSKVHDQIYYEQKKGFYRKTNRAGGIEGGMSNGELILARCAMKPIATLNRPLDSADIITHKKTKASIQRSDIAAVEAAAVVAEAMLSLVLAEAFLERYGQDDLKRIKKSFLQK